MGKGVSPLFQAGHNCNADFWPVLLENNATSNKKWRNGATTQFMAVKNSHFMVLLC